MQTVAAQGGLPNGWPVMLSSAAEVYRERTVLMLLFWNAKVALHLWPGSSSSPPSMAFACKWPFEKS